MVSLGRLFLEASRGPRPELRLISDVGNHGRFLQNVAVIEVVLEDGFKSSVLPVQMWGEYEERTTRGKRRAKVREVFAPNVERGLAVPFVRPTTGNPTAAQGRYGVPVYPIFPKVLTRLRESATQFLTGRLQQTLYLPRTFSEAEMEVLAGHVATTADEILRRQESHAANEVYGLIVLCVMNDSGPYRYADRPVPPGDPMRVLVGESVLHPGKYIVADLPVLAKRFGLARAQEGAEMGVANRCSICRAQDVEAVSVYSKVWPWLAPTWHSPFPDAHKRRNKVREIASIIGALCPECYKAFIVGAGVFEKVGGVLPAWLAKEIFLPVASAAGRDQASRSASAQAVRGSVIVLPLVADAEQDCEDLYEALRAFYDGRKRGAGRSDRQPQAIVGFETILPEEFDTDHYRLCMVLA